MWLASVSQLVYGFLHVPWGVQAEGVRVWRASGRERESRLTVCVCVCVRERERERERARERESESERES